MTPTATGDPLTITEVNGQPIAVGSPVALTDDAGLPIGEVRLTPDGKLEFVPAPGYTGRSTSPTPSPTA